MDWIVEPAVKIGVDTDKQPIQFCAWAFAGWAVNMLLTCYAGDVLCKNFVAYECN